MSNPYFARGPTLISVSGGRTSGFMLCKVVEAHGGELPADVIPVFMNTGLEHRSTYTFLKQLGDRVSPITWLEYRADGPPAVVDYASASRAGEPFTDLIRKVNYLPNPVTRKCTAELKVRLAAKYARDVLGWHEWSSFIGLRADEPRRVARLRGDTTRESASAPIAEAGHTLEDVRSFWRSMPFDLELPNDDSAFGNCVGCFLKSKARLIRVERAEPGSLDWWAAAERLGLASKPSGARFRNDRPRYEGLIQQARSQGVLFDKEDPDTIPCACTD